MAYGYMTSSDLLSTIRRICFMPTSQSTFTDADLLAMANEEIRMGVVPSILQYHEEYFARDSAPVTLVASQSNYAIPYRATGGKFRAVFYRDAQGTLSPMSRINSEDRPFYQQSNLQNNYYAFYLKGNDVILVPDVGTSVAGSLVFTYYMRPNSLVTSSSVATIAEITAGASTTVYRFDQIPSGYSVSAPMDLMQTRPGHQTISFDIYPTAIDTNAKTMTFTNTDLGASTIVGDYVALAGQCIIPQIPSDLHDVLAQRVAIRCMEALGDKNGVALAMPKLQEMEKNTPTLVDNRSEGESQKLVNRKSLLRSSRGSW